MKNKILILPSLLTLTNAMAFAQQRPNILVIVTDDQTYESIGALNNPEIHTPNLDRLVRLGTTFTHAYNQGSWSGAVSVASRSMLITGQYLNNARKNDSYLEGWARTQHEGAATAVPLWGETFRKAGYKTFMTGKWHNSNQALLKSFDGAQRIGGGFCESITADGKKLQYHRGSADSEWQPWDAKMRGHWQPTLKDIIVENGKRKVSENYSLPRHTCELYSDAAIEFLQQQLDDEPFFMYVAFNAPHDPRQSPRRFQERYPQADMSLPKNFQPQHPFNQGDNKVRDEVLAPFPRTPEAVRLHRSEYYALITYTDEVIGRILDELERSGLDKNTIVIFTSDHGLAVGSHGLMGKQNLYEHTIRVPLIFKGPHIQQNAKSEGMVYMQGLFATTCDLAGIPTPETVDFPSLLPQLQQPAKQAQEYIFGSYRHLQRMVRSDRYKLIVYPKVKEIQLFDMEKDPYETKNLAHKAKYEKTVTAYFKILQDKQKEFDDDINLGSLDNYLKK